MNLSDEAIKEFRSIYKRKVGEEISFEETKIESENFINLFDLITKPVKKNLIVLPYSGLLG